ncbi:Enoyl-CoA hydratase [Rhodococcus wratislaviensis]|jgi:enoyl-CoA hydratase/carnithine racemase|uniref:Enoyl-CoA hydratase n=1 Tax=Rhodococcus wratislaviensis TaxID=44752 RepID=A0A402CFY6_RHOWR|nr:enoyl-CoA hydratase-related protein [Rhodococcus wratislaviensis]GCE42556.1 Enoyl-CoA hydratase [Rhodococcus wratislaviensis]
MKTEFRYDLPDELNVASEGGVRVVTLNRPLELNAANHALHLGLSRVWDQLASDPDARAVLLTGSGRAFSAGGDFGYMQENIDNPEVRERTMREGRRIVEGIVRCPLPVVAALNGPAVGLGCSLAVLSDILLMSDRSFLADPHLQMGLVPGDGGMVWPLIAGLSRAKQYLLLGERILPEQAVQFGLASRVVASDELEAEALALTHRLAAMPAKAVQDTKKALNSYVELHLEGAFAAGFAGELDSMASTEHADAVRQARSRSAARQ